MDDGDPLTIVYADRHSARIMWHIAYTWPERKTIASRLSVQPEVITRNAYAVEHFEREAQRKLDDAVRGLLVISRSVSWWWRPWVWVPADRDDVGGAVLIEGPPAEYATRATNPAAAGVLVVQASALVLPPVPDRVVPENDRAEPESDAFRRYWANALTAGTPDIGSPDTSQPYPLDDLLGRIDDLAGSGP